MPNISSQFFAAFAGFFTFWILRGFMNKRDVKIQLQISAAIGAMAQSAAISWATPTGPQEINQFKLTDEQIPWSGSSLTFAAGSMCILTGFFANFIGRKTAMLLLVIPFTFGWALIIFAKNFTMVIMGRALLGISTGGVCVIVPIYIAEIAETKIRGLLCYLFQLLSIVGTLLRLVAGDSIPTSRMSLACAAIPLIFGMLILFCPESPTYLMQKHRPGDASKALLWLRGKKYNPSIELKAIQRSLQQQEQQHGKEQQHEQDQQQEQEQQPARKRREWLRVLLWCRENKFQRAQYKEIFKILLRRSSMKALLISYGLFICQQICGINILFFYTTEILETAKMKLNADLLKASIGAFATVLSGLIVDRIGRRILLLTSQIVIAVCFLSLGYYYSHVKETNSISVVPLGILCVFTFAFSIGLGPIPWVILGEIFPTDIKCLAGSISTSANLTLAFISTKTYRSLAKYLGHGGVFWLYASLSLLGVVFVYFIVPETKGKSLNNIQQIITEDTTGLADTDGLKENGDSVAMKQLENCHKGKFFTL